MIRVTCCVRRVLPGVYQTTFYASRSTFYQVPIDDILRITFHAARST